VTISLDAAPQMAAAAATANAPLLKVKVDADDPLARLAAVRRAAPHARLIVDPNESWSPRQLRDLLPALADLDVALIEQPVAASDDAALEAMSPAVPICADEAAHTTADLERIAARYQAVNIKLDKAGGLTEALVMRQRAEEMGLGIMIGCMVCTSLGIAPALLLTEGAAFVDLDGPWWIARDREDAVRIENGVLTPPISGWGFPAA
jgi:L-alanine-DL-glutamate epimerase-like enolase superfamily enzyme